MIDDTIREKTESFSVNLSNAVGASISDSQGIVRITDNDSGGSKGPSSKTANSVVVGEDAVTGVHLLTGVVGVAETFILGDANEPFYTEAGFADYALIENFKIGEDSIQLQGTANDYVLGASPFNPDDTGIYLDRELIGVISGVNGLTLNNPNTFVGV